MIDANSSHEADDRLSLLYKLSRTFSSSLDLDEVLNLVMDEVIDVMQAERGFVMLREDDGRLTFRAARGIDRETIDDPEFQVSRSVVERVAYEGQPMLTGDAQMDDWLSLRKSVISLGLRSILCVPLTVKERVSGVIYVDNRLQAGMFGRKDLELLVAIAASAAIAIENARLYEVAVEKGRLEREMQVAHEVQASLLPRQTPEIDGWEFAARWRPAREVAGDYYDFFLCPNGHQGLVMADVSGKGMPAALFMALTRSTVRASLGQTPMPVDGVRHANRLLSEDSTDAMFVTLFYGRLDPETGEIVYVNAGHNPPLLYRPGADSPPDQLWPTGMALGILPDAPLEQRTVRLQPGGFVVLYTDGVTEAIDTQEQQFGMARLARVLEGQSGHTAAEILAAIENALDTFTGTADQSDDIAILIARRLG
jgi:sigma-B regulation protein RsbU (phosphoserine phosphatase)